MTNSHGFFASYRSRVRPYFCPWSGPGSFLFGITLLLLLTGDVHVRSAIEKTAQTCGRSRYLKRERSTRRRNPRKRQVFGRGADRSALARSEPSSNRDRERKGEEVEEVDAAGGDAGAVAFGGHPRHSAGKLRNWPG